MKRAKLDKAKALKKDKEHAEILINMRKSNDDTLNDMGLEVLKRKAANAKKASGDKKRKVSGTKSSAASKKRTKSKSKNRNDRKRVWENSLDGDEDEVPVCQNSHVFHANPFHLELTFVFSSSILIFDCRIACHRNL